MNATRFDLYDVLARNAQVYGAKPALISPDGTRLSFEQLLARADQVGSGLSALGLEPGDRVAILANNSIRFIELLMGCARSGLIAYPINWRLKGEEVERILERAQPKALAFDDDFAELITGSAWAGIEHGIALSEQSSQPAAHRFSRLEESAISPRTQPFAADHPFCAIATAAVDVIPRAALLSHGNILAANLQEIAALSLSRDDCNLVALPLFHIAGLGHMLSFLHAGATNVVVPKFDASAAVEWIDGFRISHISSFPPVLTSLLDAAADSPESLSSLRWVSGLDAPDTMSRLHSETKATFMTGFGQAETSGFVTLQDARQKLGSAGKAGELCTVSLVDEGDQPVNKGEVGEIVVRGPLVFLGYDGQEDITAHTFRNGWHHTGDLGRFDEEGDLIFSGRKPEKELIKPGGEDVYPAEVEKVLRTIEGVSEACVFGVADKRWGEAIKAVLEVSDSNRRNELTRDEVREFVANQIARYKRPEHVVLTEQLPRDESGELDRNAVKETWPDGVL